MIIINPREVAAEVLVSVTNDGQYNNMALKKALKQNGAMPMKDRAFVTEIVNGTLRNIFYIDYLINSVSTVKTEKIKPWVLAVLRSAVYQMVFMNVPDSAAVNEAVTLVKGKGLGKLAGFANGVLRNIATNKDTITLPNEEKDPSKYLEVKYSHPQWLIKMWLNQYPYEFVKELCIANGKASPVTVMANPLKTTVENLKDDMIDDGITAENGAYIENALRLTKLSDLSALFSFKHGDFHVQDESSAIAVKVLDPKISEKILDVCAAPGGKSLLMAETMNNIGEIIARDVFDHKLELIDETAKRLGINIIKTELKDASKCYDEDKNLFDRVLIDAPCSGFGLLRKKADIRINRSGNDIDGLTKLQREILTAAAEYVKVGGILVYSTCTICKKENIGNINWFLQNFPYEAEDITDLLPQGIESETAKDGYISLFPHIHGTDGFFIARLKRKG
ncbi:MAG: 16S rRNA (cytosine(967)-C(5))-methyltransferase RsmB [Anaerotignaceae bacterium]